MQGQRQVQNLTQGRCTPDVAGKADLKGLVEAHRILTRNRLPTQAHLPTTEGGAQVDEVEIRFRSIQGHLLHQRIIGHDHIGCGHRPFIHSEGEHFSLFTSIGGVDCPAEPDASLPGFHIQDDVLRTIGPSLVPISRGMTGPDELGAGLVLELPTRLVERGVLDDQSSLAHRIVPRHEAIFLVPGVDVDLLVGTIRIHQAVRHVVRIKQVVAGRIDVDRLFPADELLAGGLQIRRIPQIIAMGFRIIVTVSTLVHQLKGVVRRIEVEVGKLQDAVPELVYQRADGQGRIIELLHVQNGIAIVMGTGAALAMGQKDDRSTWVQADVDAGLSQHLPNTCRVMNERHVQHERQASGRIHNPAGTWRHIASRIPRLVWYQPRTATTGPQPPVIG